MEEDWKFIKVIIALWIIQGILVVGPIRNELEISLILSLVPPFDLIVELGNLSHVNEVGPMLYSIRIAVIFVKDILLAQLWINLKKR